MDFAVICGPVKGQLPFYKRVRGIDVSSDVTCQCFAAVFVLDTEWDIGQTSIVFEAGRDWG
jgi:hypothetical protein